MRRVRLVLRAGMIMEADVRVAIRDDVAEGPTVDVAHDATPPRKRRRTCKANGYGFLPHSMTARMVRVNWKLARRRGYRTNSARNPYPRPIHGSRPSLPTRSERMLTEKAISVQFLLRRDQCRAPDDYRYARE